MKSLQDITIHYEELGKYTPKPKKTWLDRHSKKQVEAWGIWFCNIYLLTVFFIAVAMVKNG